MANIIRFGGGGLSIPPLADAPWSLIKALAEMGKASDYWKVGGEKDIVVDGETLTMQIYGFDHDAPNSITFGMKNLMAATRMMNSSVTNAGGWGSSEMRTWCNGTLFNSLPEDLKSNILTVDKLTSAGGQSSTINTTQDKIFLFSEVELYGGTSYSKAGEGTQYRIFSDAGVTISNYAALIKKLSNGAGADNIYRQRSPYGSNSTSFCFVSNTGSPGYNSATGACGVCFGFCIG